MKQERTKVFQYPSNINITVERRGKSELSIYQVNITATDELGEKQRNSAQSGNSRQAAVYK